MKDRKYGVFTRDANGYRKLVSPLPLHLAAERRQMHEERASLTLFRRPFSALRHVFFALTETLFDYFVIVTSHSFTRFIIVPLVGLWLFGSMIPGPHQALCRIALRSVEFFVWWFGLGVLSSVGLGTGMHSGLLFLFPHIMRVAQTAMMCGNVDFDFFADMWFRDTSTIYVCRSVTPTTPYGELYLSMLLCVLPAAITWGAGTAAGEIPPYAMSYASAAAGERNAQYAEELQETEEGATSGSPVEKMKRWMIDFLQRNGFWGIVLMSAWPNAFFDLCGMCCGHFLMPFWTFFGATFVGKALIKATSQAALLVLVFSSTEVLEDFVSWGASFFPASWGLKDTLVQAIRDFTAKTNSGTANVAAGIAKEAPAQGLLGQLWGYFMFFVIMMFVVSCIDQQAQSRAAEVDDNEIERKAAEFRDRALEKKTL